MNHVSSVQPVLLWFGKKRNKSESIHLKVPPFCVTLYIGQLLLLFIKPGPDVTIFNISLSLKPGILTSLYFLKNRINIIGHELDRLIIRKYFQFCLSFKKKIINARKEIEFLPQTLIFNPYIFATRCTFGISNLDFLI